jgi:phosphatidate cytidylyltransferase
VGPTAPAREALTATRIATAALLIPAVVAVVWWGSTEVVAALVGLMTVLALLEFFSLGARAGLHAYSAWTCVSALAILFQQWAATREQQWTLSGNLHLTRATGAAQLPLELILLLFTLGAATSVFLSNRPLAGALGDLGLSAAGLIFIALPLTALVRLHGVAVIGPRLLLFALALIWAGDTLAYFVGRWIGRLRMAPKLSPGKTWEGAAANLLGSIAVGVGFARWLHLDPRDMVVMAALANVAGQAGDLLESAYKRSAGAKDSGGLLPGHGGILDRIDALILAAPVVWYYFELVLAR